MIHVNVHEPIEIINYLRTAAKVEVSNFTPGDYCIGNIGIERKTLNDFLQSLVQKRLQEQLRRLKSCYQVCFLIVEVFDLRYFQNIHTIYCLPGIMACSMAHRKRRCSINRKKYLCSSSRFKCCRLFRRWEEKERGCYYRDLEVFMLFLKQKRKNCLLFPALGQKPLKVCAEYGKENHKNRNQSHS